MYLHSHSVVAFFVFEGEGRAEVKRGKHITKLPHWMTNAATYLIEAFGFQSFTVGTFYFLGALIPYRHTVSGAR
jgi:hypothetical protein